MAKPTSASAASDELDANARTAVLATASAATSNGAECPGRLAGPGFHFRNDLACGIVWAAERIAIAYLDAKAQGALS